MNMAILNKCYNTKCPENSWDGKCMMNEPINIGKDGKCMHANCT